MLSSFATKNEVEQNGIYKHALILYFCDLDRMVDGLDIMRTWPIYPEDVPALRK